MSRVELLKIGEISVVVPEDMLYNIVTLKTDLRPIIKGLERIRDGKRHPGRPPKVQLGSDHE